MALTFGGDAFSLLCIALIWLTNSAPKLQFNKQRNIGSLTLRCEWGIRNALFYVAKDPASTTPDRVLGVAMWTAPTPASAPVSWSAWLDGWLLWLKQGLLNARFLGRGGLRTNRYWIWKARQAEAQGELWTDPQGYYFCNVVTVLPEAQGKGIGKRLFDVVLQRADREGRCAYLESSRMEPNVHIYEKMGFRLVKEMTCEEGGDVCNVSLIDHVVESYPLRISVFLTSKTPLFAGRVCEKALTQLS